MRENCVIDTLGEVLKDANPFLVLLCHGLKIFLQGELLPTVTEKVGP
jgi:hypothetical protein